MLVSVGNYQMNIADSAINLLAENPFKFPRPPEVPAIFFENGKKKPSMSFCYMMSYLFERCGGFLLTRYRQADPPMVGDDGLQRTVYMYPWEFVCSLAPKAGRWKDADIDALIPHKELWSQYFHIEIISASLKYREKASQP